MENKKVTIAIQDLRVANLENRKGNEVKNQFVLTGGSIIQFNSYKSPIITIDYQDFTVSVHPLYAYSVTTSKWRNYFLNQYDFSEIATTKDLESALDKGETVDDHGNKWTVRKEMV